MSSFLAKIKFELSYGKLLGIVFADGNNQGLKKILSYFYSLPYLAVYVFIMYYNYEYAVMRAQFSKRYWTIVTERSLLFTTISSQFIFCFYFFMRRSKMQQLLISIEHNSKIGNFNVGKRKHHLPEIIRYVAVFLIIARSVVLWRTSMLMYHFLYSLPLYWSFFLLNFVYKITHEIANEFKNINYFVQSMKSGHVHKQALAKWWNKFQSLLNVCVEMNNLFGFPVMLSMFVSFATLITCLHFIQYMIRIVEIDLTRFLLRRPDSFLWTTFTWLIAYHTIDGWTIITKQV